MSSLLGHAHLSTHPDLPFGRDRLANNAHGEDEPQCVHCRFTAVPSRQEGQGGHTDNLTNRLDGSDGGQNWGGEDTLAFSVGGRCELGYESWIGDDVSLQSDWAILSTAQC